MTEPISSRTPEGEPNRCSACGAPVCVEPSRPPGDAPCPNCGTFLWFEKRIVGMELQRELGLPDHKSITRATSFTRDLGLDSLEMADLIATFEDRFHVSIPAKQAQRIDTVGDAIEVIEELLEEPTALG